MSWFADLAGKAENLLNNLDEQTGAALRNHNVVKSKKYERNDYLIRSESPLPKKKPPRSLKKVTPVSETKSNCVPTRKPSPTFHHQSRSLVKETQAKETNCSTRPRRSPTRKPSPQYTLHHTPMTMVGDMSDYDEVQDQFGLKHRRFSLPSDLELLDSDDWAYKLQNLEVENAMLRNELNVMNKEVADLLDRLRKTEDGNDIDVTQELHKSQFRLENTELLNQRVNLDKDSLTSQLEQLKVKVNELTNGVLAKTKEQNEALEAEIMILRNRNNDLEDKCKELTEKINVHEKTQIKLENDLRHAQSTIGDLQNDLQKSTQECRRLEKDWEAYKLRVKSMLYAKDNEIKALQEGSNLTEDTKELIEHVERLKDERDDLADAISRVRNECSDMKQYMEQLESRHNAAERVIVALRDALREERAARNRADAQCSTLNKELKATQMETGQTIASLRTALRDKESELNHLRETSSTVRTTDTSALNVADYEKQDSIDNDKLHYLTQTLVQRQGKIDNLLAQNNTLRIQLEKLESKYKAEVRTNYTHSIVHLQDNDCRHRARANHHVTESSLSTLSMRMGVMLKRYPVIRIFVVVYMVCLHFWVLTVLFTNTPQDYITRPAKS